MVWGFQMSGCRLGLLGHCDWPWLSLSSLSKWSCPGWPDAASWVSESERLLGSDEPEPPGPACWSLRDQPECRVPLTGKLSQSGQLGKLRVGSLAISSLALARTGNTGPGLGVTVTGPGRCDPGRCRWGRATRNCNWNGCCACRGPAGQSLHRRVRVTVAASLTWSLRASGFSCSQPNLKPQASSWGFRVKLGLKGPAVPGPQARRQRARRQT